MLEIQLILERAAEESERKSERVGAAWAKKKREAGGDPLTTRCPAWLELTGRTKVGNHMVGGEWAVVEWKAEAVRRVFQLTVDGWPRPITKLLNAEGVPPIARATYWARSYVAKLLSNPAVIGVYQPCKGSGAKEVDGDGVQIAGRRHDGDPVPGYFPAVVEEGLWYAARAAMRGRKGKDGRPAKGRVNIFTGMLRDARDGGGLQLVNKGDGPALVSTRASNGVRGAKYISFPLRVFEEAILSELRELRAEDVAPIGDDGAGRVEVLTGRLDEAEADVERFKARLAAKFSDAVADVLERKAAEAKSLRADLEAARAEAASPPSAALVDLRTLDPEKRLLLRAALRRAVESMYCLFIGIDAYTRRAVVQVFFRGGACPGGTGLPGGTPRPTPPAAPLPLPRSSRGTCPPSGPSTCGGRPTPPWPRPSTGAGRPWSGSSRRPHPRSPDSCPSTESYTFT